MVQSEFAILQNSVKLKRQCVAVKRDCLYYGYVLLCIFHVKMQAANEEHAYNRARNLFGDIKRRWRSDVLRITIRNKTKRRIKRKRPKKTVSNRIGIIRTANFHGKIRHLQF